MTKTAYKAHKSIVDTTDWANPNYDPWVAPAHVGRVEIDVTEGTYTLKIDGEIVLKDDDIPYRILPALFNSLPDATAAEIRCVYAGRERWEEMVLGNSLLHDLWFEGDRSVRFSDFVRLHEVEGMAQ